ncbi:hypothetical protein KGA66_05990 [Actinocrinis puniceicyclus]|uniref:Uncharacterized protein n=1 Tax=Actinocrinis puniceicyclus TaxID=977794 RepID=A0A8J8BDA2_9ACTN|nr:hypothetical protein [Actinocrinis puniceicyclus]MBS2962589.1 hypothetical protein [Actinocrinis puniceicyclus]
MAGSGLPQPAPLREGLALEARRSHLPEQIKRFLRVFAYALGSQLLSGAHVTGWVALWSVLAGSAETAFRQWRKTMGVQAAQCVADGHEQAPRTG